MGDGKAAGNGKHYSARGQLSLTGSEILERADELFSRLALEPEETRIHLVNELRLKLHHLSPFKTEPVDCVLWVPAESVTANDYNPNAVAPPEMRLLEHSISEDGYTQPIVAWQKDEAYEVVDGFHRHRVGRESTKIRQRIRGHLPIAVVNTDRLDRNDRMAATIRHNRARGKHQVAKMSDIVVELKRRNWTTERICNELGMEPDEVLRLCQITGLAELFADQEFSQSWSADGEITEADFAELTDEVGEGFRKTINVGGNRIVHTYDKWECFKAGFYATTKDGMTKDECEAAYRDFLADDERFRSALDSVITEWKHSCEHYLTNEAMNRIAWLGQASACYAMGIPSVFRGGFHLLSEEQQQHANELALEALNKWLKANGRDVVTMEAAMSDGRQSELY